jgi:hypothetical protein
MLTAEQEARAKMPAYEAELADADVAARFEELLAEALKTGPGRPGACGNSPFWTFDTAGAEICVSRIVSRAQDDVSRARWIAAQARDAA